MNRYKKSFLDDDSQFTHIMKPICIVLLSAAFGGGLGFFVSQNLLGAGIGMVIDVVLNLIGYFKKSTTKYISAVNVAAIGGIFAYNWGAILIAHTATQRLLCGLGGAILGGLTGRYGTTKTRYQQRIDYEAIREFKARPSVVSEQDP